MPIIHLYDNAGEFVRESAASIEHFIAKQLKEKSILRMALSGGKSPSPVYLALAKNKNIPWSRITLFLADERYVPLNSGESNYRMIHETLLSGVKNLRRFYHYNTRESLPIITDQYQKVLEQFKAPLFDLVLLGLGEDGHTASLFPHDPAIHEHRRLVAHTQSLEQTTQDRMTLTFPAILSSSKIIFLIRGKEKQKIFDEWVGGNQPMEDLPAKTILGHPNVEIFYDRSL
ncbi:6-phosphogluconolactonase [Candidatus Peregrinibacteria bacterium]|nr:6-phosphogluconolactonase [Candidatus Peregrinibacteria bacterium]